MKPILGPVECPYCVSNQHQRTSKQDWWVARDGALVAAGLPEMIYGYEVEYVRHDMTTARFNFAGSEAAARRAAVLKRLYHSINSVTPFTYTQYFRAFGVPGTRM